MVFIVYCCPYLGVDKGLDMWYKGDMQDIKVWKVWGYEGLPLRDYDALFKDVPSSTILHFTPLLVCLIR